MKKETLRRLLSLVLCLIMCLSLLPASAFAEDEIAEAPSEEAVEEIIPEEPAEEPEEPAEEPEEPAEEPEEPAEEPAEPAEEPVEEPAEEPKEPAEEPEEPAEEPEEPVEEPEEPAEEIVADEQDSESVKDEPADWKGNPANGVPQTVSGTIGVGSVVNAEVTYVDEVIYYCFVPSKTAVYSFFSNADKDSYGYLYASDWSLIESNDDSGGNGNFRIKRTLYANTTYYYGVAYYNSVVGTIKATLVKLDDWNRIDGSWYYYNSSGSYLTGWQTIGGATYYFNGDGMMAVDGGVPIYNSETGKMEVYFFKAGGAVDKSPGWKKNSSGLWFYVGSSGQVLTDWQKINGSWYYFSGSGSMAADGGFRTDGGSKLYFFKESGVWDNSKGWKKNSQGAWFYAGGNGQLLTGWQVIDGKKYYFDTYNGRMYANNLYNIDGTFYFFSDDGPLGTAGWAKNVHKYDWTDESGTVHHESYTCWYYLNSKGTPVTGWKKIDGSWYYFYPGNFGQMISNQILAVDGTNYLFTSSGALAKEGWQKLYYTATDAEGKRYTAYSWYYTYSNGIPVAGWEKIDGSWYYFHPTEYYLYSNGLYEIEGKKYFLTESGALAKEGWQKISGSYTDPGTGKIINWTDWYYIKSDGTPSEGWRKINGTWYYFEPGYYYMRTGRLTLGGKTYILSESGAMQTGWIKNVYTYKDTGGVSYSRTEWYYADSGGELQTGWLTIGGKKYYFNEYSYYMYQSVATYIGSEYYFFTSSGALSSGGWESSMRYNGAATEKVWYYANSDGTLVTGWFKVGGSWYYFNPEMLSGNLYYINGKMEYFKPNGAWVDTETSSAWQRVGSQMRYVEKGVYVTGWKKIDGVYYYFDSYGNLKQGWVDYGGKRYYCVPHMLSSTPYWISGNLYYFGADGAMQTGWIKETFTQDGVSCKYWYYADSAGRLQTGWQTIGGKLYYFETGNGRMYADGQFYIDGETWNFKANGVCTGKVS